MLVSKLKKFPASLFHFKNGESSHSQPTPKLGRTKVPQKVSGMEGFERDSR